MPISCSFPQEPTCTPISFCEAASYGLPIISTDTGGVAAHVEHNKTGILLSEKASTEDYAREIEILLNNPSLIKSFSINSRNKYENELNWGVFGEKMKHTIIDALSLK